MPLTVGVIGGGQLARMMIPPAVALGIDLRVFAENEGDSAGIAVRTIGDYRNAHEVLRFAQGIDVVTFDHEHVPQEVLAALVEAGVTVRPSPDALAVAQDKIVMRERLSALGLPVPEWASIASAADLQLFLDAHGGSVIVKTPRGGYDGKGVRVVRASTDVDDWFEAGGPLLAEELVSFRRELAQLVARRPSGELTVWPVAETVQLNGVCAEAIAPAPRSNGKLNDLACDIATSIAEGLDVTGVLAVELFETMDDRLLVNELAMRPHNSGHWTIDGSTTSQFEQHLRAVLDLPLGATGTHRRWSMMVNLFGDGVELDGRYPAAMYDQPTVKVHSYGKEPRPGRKVGHVTGIGDDLDQVAYEVRAASAFFE